MPASPPSTATRRGVLAVTQDAELTEELHRAGAAAAVVVDVRAALPGPAGLGIGLLIVDPDSAADLSLLGRVPDAPVVVVATRSAGGEVWGRAAAVGAEAVAVLPHARDWLVARLAGTTELAVGARTVAVVGGCGGAGASVLSAAVAVCAADSDQRALLVDLDPLGGGIDLLLGLDDVPGLRWPDLAGANGRLPASSLHDSLPRAGALALLAWGRAGPGPMPTDVPVAAVEAVLDAGRRGHELVVVDLPRNVGESAAAAAALRRASELLVVLPARWRAVAAAERVLAAAPHRPPARVVVRGGSADRCSARQVAGALGLPLAAELREDTRLAGALDRGELPGLAPRSALRRAAEQCLAPPRRGRSKGTRHGGAAMAGTR